MHLPRSTPALDWNRHQRFAPSALRSSWPRAQATRHPKTAQLWVPPQHDSPVAIAFHILSYFPYFSIPAAIKRYATTTRSILHHLLRVRWSHDGRFFLLLKRGFSATINRFMMVTHQRPNHSHSETLDGATWCRSMMTYDCIKLSTNQCWSDNADYILEQILNPNLDFGFA